MKNTMQFTAVLTCLVLAQAANAQFGALPSAPQANAGGGGATPADIDNFLSAASAADKLVTEASRDLFNAVASKEARERIEAKVAAAGAIADPKEKQAKLDEVAKERNAALEKADYKKVSEGIAKGLDAKQKESTKNAIYNLALGALKDAELVLTGKKLVSSAPSPMIAAKIPAVKDSVERLTSQAEALPKVVEGAKNLMKAVGLEALPTKASDAPKASSI